MSVIMYLEEAGASLRMRREDAWASCADEKGTWLD